MLTGRESLREIDGNIVRVQGQIERASRRLDELSSDIHGLRFEEGQSYRQLAKFRLDQARAGRIAARLDQTDHAVQNLLEQRAQALLELGVNLGETEAKRQQLERERGSQEKLRDRAQETLQQKLEETKARVQQSDTYRLQKETAEKALAIAEKAHEKASQAEIDLDSKGKPYRDDPLFIYLWKRRYATPDYRHGGIIRALDGWVAKQIAYREASANYHMLNELPLRLREHATRLKKTAEDEVAQVQTLERQAAEKDAIPRVQSELEKTEERLHQVDDDIEFEKTRHQDRLKEKAAFDFNTDRYTKEAIELQVADFEREKLDSLYRESRETPRPEDDAIVDRIHQARAGIQNLQNEIEGIKDRQVQHQKALYDLEDLRIRFRRNHYDAPRSTFPGGFGLGALLGQILAGAMNSETVWGEIERNQRVDPPMPDFGGFGGGGFDFGGTRGGFGGGGFRTGGGF